MNSEQQVDGFATVQVLVKCVTGQHNSHLYYCRILKNCTHQSPTFLGQRLLWIGSWAARGKMLISDMPNRLNYCMIFFIACTQFTNVAAGRGLETHALEFYGAVHLTLTWTS